ncbi:TIGR03086 family metal-binding protein [Williamsia sp. M5A3_1d]
MFDLGPAAQEMRRLVNAVEDDDLDRPTPCDDWSVRDLLAHIHQFSSVFTDNARKAPIRPPDGLVSDWRTAIPQQLHDLASAWGEPSAWQGHVSAGGIEMPAQDNAVVAAEELTVHAWDLARATDHTVRVDDTTLDEVERFFTLFPADPETGAGPFGPVAPIDDDTDRLGRILALAGRDPRHQSNDERTGTA